MVKLLSSTIYMLLQKLGSEVGGNWRIWSSLICNYEKISNQIPLLGFMHGYSTHILCNTSGITTKTSIVLLPWPWVWKSFNLLILESLAHGVVISTFFASDNKQISLLDWWTYFKRRSHNLYRKHNKGKRISNFTAIWR